MSEYISVAVLIVVGVAILIALIGDTSLLSAEEDVISNIYTTLKENLI